MRKRFVKHGNSAALIIERPIMELLNLDMDTLLEISTDGKRLIIEPASTSDHQTPVEEALERGRTRYARMLKKLGE